MSQDRHQVATRQPPPRSLTSLGDSEAFCRDLSAAAASGRYSGLHLRPIVHDQLVAILAKVPNSEGAVLHVKDDVPVEAAVAAAQACKDTGFTKVSYLPQE